MRLALEAHDQDRQRRLPPQLAELLRPELGFLAEEIAAEIRRTIPQYAEPGARFQSGLRDSARLALTMFVEQIAMPATPRARHDEICRQVARREAAAGRGLESLQAAYRVGAQVAWRRMMRIGERHHLSSAVMSSLAEALFVYLDELTTLSQEGFLQATPGRPAEELSKRRRRLLGLLLDRPGVPAPVIAEAAEAGTWPLPDQVTPVALQPRVRYVPEELDDDVLADLDGPQPRLLIPGIITPERREMLEAVIAGVRAAAGITVAPSGAADSLRWARQALSLAQSGGLDEGPLTLCDEHLLTLWLLSDPALLDQLTRRQFAILDGMTRRQQRRITETLGAWLEARGNAVEVADRLHVHPQTVRYRMRQIKETFGEQIDDSNRRFELELAVRAMRLRDLRVVEDGGRPAVELSR